MDFFFWLGLAVFIYYFVMFLLLIFNDSDIATTFAEKFGTSIDSLRGKVIWITGASSGIGEGLALTCAKVGAKLVLSARREEELKRVKKECIAISNGKLIDADILVLPMDISDIKSHQKLFDNVLDAFGKLDILVNNAGKSQRALWEDIEVEVDRSLFELNVFGLVNLTRIAVKYFLSRGEGHVAVTSSTAGIMGVPFSGSYTASKHAIHGYFNSLRTEKFTKNLKITVFCPGPTFTNFLQESFTSKIDEKYGQSVQSNDKRMTAERCGYLFAVALANKIEESWAAVFPIILLSYLNIYFPNLMKRIFIILGPKYLLKLRDSRVAMKVEQ
ncbi:dehydrogenase/reductase SDR family member 7 [Arctopsyche grandis]|uniref:dehydrogenase/reductase SDR family member 7 n=1 Tax=Arctopsyche grandis TaxID=121162 RepID=UPI00406D9C48